MPFRQGKFYLLIGKYSAAYSRGMSIKEAYRETDRWKKNGGNLPGKEKVTIVNRPLVTIPGGRQPAREEDRTSSTRSAFCCERLQCRRRSNRL